MLAPDTEHQLCRLLLSDTVQRQKLLLPVQTAVKEMTQDQPTVQAAMDN